MLLIARPNTCYRLKNYSNQTRQCETNKANGLSGQNVSSSTSRWNEREKERDHILTIASPAPFWNVSRCYYFFTLSYNSRSGRAFGYSNKCCSSLYYLQMHTSKNERLSSNSIDHGGKILESLVQLAKEVSKRPCGYLSNSITRNISLLAGFPTSYWTMCFRMHSRLFVSITSPSN